MKKFLTYSFATVLLVSGLFSFSNVLAQQSDYNKQLDAFSGESGANFGERKDPRSILATIIASFLTILGTVFLAYSVYGGAIIMTSAGNTEKVEEGKSTLRRGVIGIIIILSAYSIVVLVEKIAPSARNQRDPLWEECTAGDVNCVSIDAGVQPLPANEPDTTPACWWIFCRTRN